MTSETAITAINSPHSAEIFCVLLSITDPSASASRLPIRVASDNADTFSFEGNTVRGITYDGNDYVWFPFEITLPQVSGDTSPSANLRISGVDRSVIRAIREINVAPQIDITVIMTSERATVGYTPEITLPGFRMYNIKYDSTSVNGTLTFENLLNEPYPYRKINPTDFPGYFK